MHDEPGGRPVSASACPATSCLAPQTTTTAYAGDVFSKASSLALGSSKRGLLNAVIVHGQQHHYGVAHGDLTSRLSEAAAQLRMSTVQRVSMRDYLQI